MHSYRASRHFIRDVVNQTIAYKGRNALETELASRDIANAAGSTLHQEVLERVRDFIVEGNVLEGERIPERRLCEMIGISRTPLREALKVLASEGLIELLPNRGARVKAMDARDIREIFDVVGGLESIAGRLACEKITEEQISNIENLHREMYSYYLRGDRSNYFRTNQLIHDAIMDVAQNELLTRTFKTLSGRIRRFRFSANLEVESDRWSAAVREHEQILDALRRRSGAELSTILFEHLRHKQVVVLRHLNGSGQIKGISEQA